MSESDLAARRSRLSPAQRALLAARLSPAAAAVPREAIRRQAGAAGPAPLSLAQQRLWFLQQFSPASTAYNCWAALDLEGDLDVRALAAGIAGIVRRHEVLRTVIRLVDGEPMQAAEAVLGGLPLIDLATLPRQMAAAEAERLSRAEVRRPFDLGRGPLLRPRLLRRCDGRHLLLLCLHHLVWDGWSMQVFFGELAQLYRAALAGVPAALPALPVQYADFSRWQRQRMAGRQLAGEVEYWRRRLAGAPQLLDLPLDRPRPPAESQRGGMVPLALGAALVERLRQAGQRHGATLAMTLLAAYAVLLSRWSRQSDLVMGMPTAGRGHVEIEGLIGFFVNTLAVRVEVAGEASFADLLAAVRETALEAQRHQEVPFERLVEELAPQRSLSHTPIFQVMFSLQPMVRQEAAVAELRLRPAAIESGSAKFDLDLGLLEGAEGLVGGLEFRRDLFDRSTVRRFAGNLDGLLRQVAVDTARRTSDLVLLSGGERQQVLVEWNATVELYGGPRTLHELVEEQARRSPEAVAVESAGGAPGGGRGGRAEALSYGALNAASNRLARHLRSLGVGGESVVAIALERSCALVTVLLAVLKAGAAYLPLDPGYPEQRLRAMREDAGASVLVTTASELAGGRAWAAGGATVCVDDPSGPWQGAEGEEAVDPAVEVTAAHAAYVLYTSGSTGRPKGVVIPHGAIVNHMHWMQRALPLAAADRVLQKTSISFDASVWEFYAPLLVGGCLVMAPPGVQREPAALNAVVSGCGVTVLQVVPSLLRALLAEEGFAASCGGLRRLYCGGEALAPSLRDAALAALPGVELVNVYGPTEATIHASWRRFRSGGAAGAGGVVPIGRPIGNGRLHVVDGEMAAVAVGVGGELLVGGAGLGRGYLGRPAATAERWVPDPFGERPGERLYRTGDLVRWLAGGELEYLGRLDRQVKLRGFRIELGEIEVTLGAHPSVAAAVVVVREEPAGDQRLVAYVVARREGAMPAGPELRGWLAGRLPEAWLPQAFVELPALPLTASGKLDRKELAALPAPRAAGAASGAEGNGLAPRGPLEALLAAVWEEVLEIEGLGVRDSFFDLGGHSLLAVRVVSRVRARLGLEMDLRDLFEAPTIEQLARRIAARQTAATATGAPPPLAAQPRAGRSRWPLSFAQQRLWFLDQLRPGSSAYNLPVAVPLPGDLDRAALRRSLEAVVQRHEALRTRFAEEDGEAVQLVEAAAALALPLVDLASLPAAARRQEIQRVAANEAARPFDLARGPLLRALLVSLDSARAAPPDAARAAVDAAGADTTRVDAVRAGATQAVPFADHLLLATMHHIVSDGWSMGVFAREAGALYQGYARGGAGEGEAAPALPALPVQYADYAIWQRAWLSGEVLERGLAYWRERLAGAPPVLALPADRPRPPVAGERGGSRRRVLPAALHDKVKALGRRHGSTLFMTLLAGFAGLLSRYSGALDLCIGSPVAGRDRLEVEGLIGFFVNMLVLRADLAAGPDFVVLVARLRQTVLDAHLHQALPFEKLVDELGVERSLSHSPLFQVALVVETAAGRGGPAVPSARSAASAASAASAGSAAVAEGSGALSAESAAEPEGSSGAGDPGSVKFDLTLEIEESAGGLLARVSYRSELFDGPTMDRFLGHYERLLAAALAAPGLPVGELPLLDAAERHQLVAEWGEAAGGVTADAGECLHTLFARRAARAPEAIAVSEGGRALSYGELDLRGDALAAALARHGVRPGDLVALCLERSLDMVVAILGTLKAGAAYLPLEIGLPPERLQFLLSDARPCLVVADAAGRAALPAGAPPVVAVGEVGAAGEAQGEDAAAGGRRWMRAAAAATPAFPAYVIYTSGSTGRPKGVVVSHRNVVRLFAATREGFGFDERDVWTLFHSYAFDVSVWELWGALLHGGRLVVVPYLVSRSPEALRRQLAAQGVTVLSQTPTAFRELQREEMEHPPPAAPALRLVIFAGEALEPELLRPWLERYGDERPRLVNMYGITETTVHVTWRRLTRADLAAGGSPIGRAIPDLAVLLREAAGEPAAIGMPGEILVAGPGLSPGYLGRPELTAARFVPHPLARHPGERIYRSGDLGRYRADGQIEVLGRIDQQVKVRGFRIELGEIEAALLAQPAVADAVVRVRAGAAEDRRLVAWVVAAAGARIAPAELRRALAAALPEYMVPAAFVPLASLPLTVNGKLDPGALPDPDPGAGLLETGAGMGEAGDHLAPRGPLEALLAAVWEEVLEIEGLGVRDSFFDLGGHSLLAVQVVSRVRARLGLEMELRDLFEAPTVERLASRIAMRQTAASTAAAPPPLAAQPRTGGSARWPLSFAQQRLWFLDQLQPGGSAYNLPVAVPLPGDLDRAALRRSLEAVVQRHEALRTRFTEEQGEAVQLVEPAAELALPVADLASLPAAPRQKEMSRLAANERARPFDLQRGPVLRALLVALGDARSAPAEAAPVDIARADAAPALPFAGHLLLATMHHIVSDGWSMGVFAREAGALYQGYSGGAAARWATLPLPALPVQYADYAVWQRAWLSGERLERQLAYWRERLAGAPTRLELPADRPRRPVAGERGGSRRRALAAGLHGEVKALGRRHGSTLFMTLLAGFAGLLSRYSGALDLCIGSPVAGRDRLEVEGLIGFFVNMLVLRADLAAGPDFVLLVARLRQTVLDAHLHQALPFEKLVDELGVERSLSHSPLFQVALVVETAAGRGGPGAPSAGFAASAPSAGSGAEPESSAGAGDFGSVKFDLTLEIEESAGGLLARVRYRSELFDGPTMDRFLGHYERLLAAALAAPGLPVGELPLLDAAERHQLVAEWGETAAGAADGVTADAGECLHTLFARRAARAPEAIAVSEGERALSYGELDRRGDALAAALARRGVRPGDLVALRLERSLDMVVAILGTLKAGAAYLPLEVGLPPERLQFLLSDARPRLVVADAAGRAALPAGAPPIVAVGAVGETQGEDAAAGGGRWMRAAAAVTPAFPAYVIYTSGSTGRPKGVVVSHRNVVRLFAATREGFAFGERDVWTLFHSYAFDFSVWELWGALLHGGRLVVVPYLVSRSPEALRRQLAAQGVTVLSQTPTAFRELQREEVEHPPAADLALRLVIFGGEALEPELVRPWLERHGDERPRLVNMYGITETTVHVTWRRLTRADLAVGGSPIGRAIPDLAVLLREAAGEPAAIGMPGEILVAGPGLSPGYLGRPELTAARFVPHPQARHPGERIYRSGDLGRYRADGQIEHLGRIDQQVKVRGFRIELGEIEAALLALPAVADAVVRVRTGAAGDRRLVAWVVAAAGARVAPAKLRRALAAALPEHMVPAAFVPLASLPRTLNGKLDPGALPDPGAAQPGGELPPASGWGTAGDEPAGLRNAAEALLAAAVGEVLGLPAVAMSDNFFSLGGDSISAIRLRAKAVAAGLEVALQDIFRYPSLGELARAAGAAGEKPPEALAPFALLAPADRALLPAGLEDAYPLARLQAGMVFHGELSGAGARAYHNVASLRLAAPFDAAAVRRALRELTRRHPVLRTRFAMAGFGEPLQLVEAAMEPRLLVCDLRGLSEAAQQAALEERFTAHRLQPFDLGRAPLLRCELLPLASGRFELLWAEHHAILDGWSVASMLAELFQLYLGELGAAAAPPPPAGNLMRDFVAMERSALAAAASRELWRGRLAQRPAGRLPRWPQEAAAPRPPDGRLRRSFEIDRPIAEALREMARQEGLPLKSALLAAHLEVLSRLCGTADVITGLVSNGRPEVADGDRALGLFLNTLPLRLRLGRGSWRDLVRQVFAEELALLPHRRYPLAELQRELGGGVDLFETSFNYVHFHALGGLATFASQASQASPAPVALEGWREAADVHFVCSASFGVDPFQGALHLDLTFAAAEIAAAEAVQIGDLYRRALAALAAQPEGEAAAALLLSGGERQQVLVEWNATVELYGGPRTLHELVEEQARRSPEAVAVESAGGAPGGGRGGRAEALSYGALNAASNRLARHLRSLGVGGESVVAIALERSCALVTVLLAVLKAGAAYLPLDPGYPEQRLRAMREDAGASVLVTTASELAGGMAWVAAGGATVCVDDPSGPWQGAEGEEAVDPAVEVTAAHAAYVLYTSGSTGRPKGVVIPHGAIVNHMHWMQRALPLAAADRVLQKTSISFDASVWEFYAPLLVGGCLVMAPPGVQREPAALNAVVSGCGVTVLQVVPSLLRALLAEEGFAASCGGLRRLYCGGEALAPSLRDAALAALPGVELVNVYGPTEATIHASWRRFRSGGAAGAGGVVPVGRAIGHGRLHVVDGEMAAVAVGVGGELLVGGAGLGRGYLGRPAATAERWVPDPFGERPGERLYRTGDLVRWLAGGELEYLGRLDRQVKLRGFRIELGEIEAALERLPEVRAAVVRLRQNARGEPQLVAYMVAAVEGAAPDVLHLRRALAETLPEYMVPAAYVTLRQWPLTPNGKLDAAALPAPDLPAGRTALAIAPRDGVELELTRLWEDLLGLAAVRPDDDFFALGGHSLAALRLMAGIRSRFGRELPVAALFQRPTLEGLAELVRQGWARAPSRLVQVEPGAGRPWFCVHPVGGAVLCYAELGRCLRGRRPLYGLEAAVDDAAPDAATVAEMAALYLREIRAVQAAGPYLLAGWSMGGLVALEMAQQLARRGEAVELLALIDPTPPAAGPPGAPPAAAAVAWQFARDLAALLGADPAALAAAYTRPLAAETGDAAAILDRMYAGLRAARLLPADLALAELGRRLRIFERNLRAGATYRPRPYTGRLALLLAAARDAPGDPLAAWQGLASGELSVERFAGGHYDLLRGPLAAELAAALERLAARPAQAV